MTNLLECSIRLCRVAVFLLLASLAACGPGTGGTGTGPVHSVLNFSGSGTQGVLPSGSQCAGDCDRLGLQLEAQRVELTAACRRFVHVGDWSVTDDGRAILAGVVETTTSAGTTTAPATLQLQFSQPDPAASPQVTAVLTGEAGAVLAGPAILQRGDSAAAPAADCRGVPGP